MYQRRPLHPLKVESTGLSDMSMSGLGAKEANISRKAVKVI